MIIFFIFIVYSFSTTSSTTFFFLLKICARNKITFITTKNPANNPSAKYGCVGAMFAINIKGNPNAIAGKF